MLRPIKAVLLILILSFPSFAYYANGTIRGFVSDSSNGEAIIFANIYLQEIHYGAATNNQGYYVLNGVPEGKHTLIVSYLGYQSKKLTVFVASGKITEVNLRLSPGTIQLDELTVSGKRISEPMDISMDKITSREIQLLPAAVEADPIRMMQISPGVTTTGDVTAKFFVRGGAGDQNSFLINGATLYYPFHAVGILSAIDPEIISSLEFSKGGFGPEYGGRLSSILNINTRDGNKNRLSATASATLLAGKLSLEGPIPGGSFIAAGRKSYYSGALKNFLRNDDVPFDFYDASVKLNYSNDAISSGSKFTLFGFFSGDLMDFEDPLREDYNISNQIYGVSWRKIWADPLYSIFNFSYSGYSADLDPNLGESKRRNNDISDVSANFDFSYVYSNKDQFDFGLQSKFLATRLQIENLLGNTSEIEQSGSDINLFGKYRFLRWENYSFDIGIRTKLVALSEKRPFLIEPRLAMTYRVIPQVMFKFAYGRYSQEIIALSDENELISVFEPWIIIPPEIASMQSDHLIAGLTFILNEEISFETEYYYKSLINLNEINRKKFDYRFRDLINLDGEAYGAEFQFKYENPSFYSNIGYSLGWVHKINNGVRFAPRYDIRHSFNILSGVKLPFDFQFSSNFQLRSGMPFTPIAGYFDHLNIIKNETFFNFNEFLPTTLRGRVNSQRLPYYHRLDLGLTKNISFGTSDLSLGINAINVYNRKNIFYFDPDTGEQINMLPALYTFFIRVKI